MAPRAATIEQHFSDRCGAKDANGCIPWVGARSCEGYGTSSFRKHIRPAHRLAYELNVGPIPKGLVIDHLCNNRLCVNHEHLQPTTIIANAKRGGCISAINEAKTHCIRGHALTPDNVKLRPTKWGKPGRECQACVQLRAAELRLRRQRVPKAPRRLGMIYALSVGG